MFRAPGENRFGDGIGCQIGTDAQQVGGGGVSRLHAREGERPGGSDRGGMIFDERAALVQQRSSMCLGDALVLFQRHAGGFQVGSGLIEGQGQSTQFGCQSACQTTLVSRRLLKRAIRGQQSGTAQQQQRSLLDGKRLHFQPRRQSSHIPGARGQQDMAAWNRREKRRQQVQLVGVVQDEQPCAVFLQPCLDCRNGDLLIARLLFGQVEQGGDDAVGGDQVFAGLGACPQNGLVVLVVAIGVLDGDLRLADAAQSADGLGRLREGGGLTALQLSVQALKELITSQKEGVARIGNIPDG